MSAVDDVYESWEEMEESGALDEKLKALEVTPVNELEDEPKCKSRNSRIIILGDDAMRSPYAPKPAVKILKRPDRNSQDGAMCNGDKPKQPIKSLKQREQEYAEARKRILGEAKSPEEKQQPAAEVNRIQSKSVLASNMTSSSSSSNSTSKSTSKSINSAINLPSNVTRLPLGPDGTKGFHARR